MKNCNVRKKWLQIFNKKFHTYWVCLEIWILIGIRFLMKSINFQIVNNQICPGTFLKLWIGFLLKGCCYREFLRNVYRLPNVYAQQCVDKGVGLYTRHNLHRTNHMKNGKQHTAFIFTIDSLISLGLRCCLNFFVHENWLQSRTNVPAKFA